MGARRQQLSLADARRMALAAQGLARPRPERQAGARQVLGIISRLNLLQIDSVNVLVRSHYLPLFARLGTYDVGHLDQLAYGRRRLFEYWGHEASLLPVELQPLFRWRMLKARDGHELYSGLHRFAGERADYIARVLAEVRDRGPLGASELSECGPSRGAWWGWSDGKTALEWLFWVGEVTTHTRRNFERIYEIPERTLPGEVLGAPTPDEADSQRELVQISLGALGVATERDIRDYFRLPVAATKARIAELVDAGTFQPVEVEGWRQPAYLPAVASVPRRANAATLLSPFDSLVFERDRTERLFGFRYRLELYTPAGKRQYGYYVLPFLLGDRLVARVDLKADRAADRLEVRGAFGEQGIDRDEVAVALDRELRALAGWLGLGEVAVHRRGDLATALLSASR